MSVCVGLNDKKKKKKRTSNLFPLLYIYVFINKKKYNSVRVRECFQIIIKIWSVIAFLVVVEIINIYIYILNLNVLWLPHHDLIKKYLNEVL